VDSSPRSKKRRAAMGCQARCMKRNDDLIVERNLLDLFWIYRRLAKDSFW
jgi:hypothetical protein